MDLPLNTRNFTQLVQLAPGVLTGVGGASGLLGYTSGRGTNGAVINGAPVEDVTYIIDGINSVDTDAGVLIFFPPVDSIQEFKVQTSSAPAAIGGGQGIINVIYKSGTNELHGAAYEFLRNSAFDAKNFFDSAGESDSAVQAEPVRLQRGRPGVDAEAVQRQGQAVLLRRLRRQARPPGADLHQHRADRGVPHGRFLGAAAEDGRLWIRGRTRRFRCPETSSRPSAIDPLGQVDGALSGAEPAGRDQQFPVQSRCRRTRSTSSTFDPITAPASSAIFGRFSHEDADTFNPGQSAGARDRRGAGRGQDSVVSRASRRYSDTAGRSAPTNYYDLRVGYSRMFQGIYDSGTKYGDHRRAARDPERERGRRGARVDHHEHHRHDRAWATARAACRRSTTTGSSTRRLAGCATGMSSSSASTTCRGGSRSSRRALPRVSLRSAESTPASGLPIFCSATRSVRATTRRNSSACSGSIYSWFVQDNWRVNSKLSLNMGLRDDSITRVEGAAQPAGGLCAGRRRNAGPGGTAPFTGDSIRRAAVAIGTAARLRLHHHAEDGDPRRRRHLLQLQDGDSGIRWRRTRPSAGRS